MHVPSEGNIFTAKPELLADLLRGIDRHKIALPNFQRPWVWEPEMVRDLLVSVAYRFPAGNLLTMPVFHTGLALRPFEGAGDGWKDQPNLIILDGQQRLTRLFQALYSRNGVRVKNRTYHFYLDADVLLSDPDGSVDVGDPLFEGALFYVAEDKKSRRIRYEGLIPRYELTTRDDELAAGALPLAAMFDQDGLLADWKKDYLVRRSTNDMTRYLDLEEQWRKLVQPWLNRILNYPFPVIELRPDMPLAAICHIFERVNSTGVPLDVFELCTASLWAQGFHLNEGWAKTRNDLRGRNILPMQSLSGTYYLQGISLLDSFERKRGRPDERIAVTFRKDDLMALKANTVRAWWAILEQGYVEASRFLTDSGVISAQILPYSTLIIPLSSIFSDLRRRKGEAATRAAWPQIRRWYWCSVFSQRYSSNVETNAALDFEQVATGVDGGDPPDVVRTFSFRSDAIQEIASIRNVVYKGILCLLASTDAKDFGGGGRLTTDLYYETRQDHHHIFPTNAFKQLGIADKRSDSIVNKTLISASANRSIGGDQPSLYVKRLRTKLGINLFDEILTSHLIDPSYLEHDDWDGFVLDRRERLRQLVQRACGGNILPFSDAAPIEEEMDEDEEPVL